MQDRSAGDLTGSTRRNPFTSGLLSKPSEILGRAAKQQIFDPPNPLLAPSEPTGDAPVIPIRILICRYRACRDEAPLGLEKRLPHKIAALVCIAGHAWFYKLRKSFADVV